MPVGLCQVRNDWDKKRKCVRFVGFQDVEEVVVFEETHCTISNLEVETRNTFNKSFEDFRNVRF